MPLKDIHGQIAKVRKKKANDILVRMSVDLLDQLAAEDDDKLPSAIRLIDLGEPDKHGVYSPVFQAIYND